MYFRVFSYGQDTEWGIFFGLLKFQFFFFFFLGGGGGLKFLKFILGEM